jgi:hypothetical protein
LVKDEHSKPRQYKVYELQYPDGATEQFTGGRNDSMIKGTR